MKYILDTDILSLLELDNADSLTLQIRLESVPSGDIFTTIVNYEEQMRGWLSVASRSRTNEQVIRAYAYLERHVATFAGVPLLSFDASAADVLSTLRSQGVRIATMDLKIAAIALANDATLLSRDLADFRKVPGLRVEDWSE